MFLYAIPNISRERKNDTADSKLYMEIAITLNIQIKQKYFLHNMAVLSLQLQYKILILIPQINNNNRKRVIHTKDDIQQKTDTQKKIEVNFI